MNGISFDDLPETLQELLVDLENNFKIIKRINSGIYSGINSGIILTQEISNEIEATILTKYSKKTNPHARKFLKLLFAILRPKYRDKNIELAWINFKSLKDHFEFSLNKTKISTGEENNSLEPGKSGHGGDSSRPPTQKSDRNRVVFNPKIVEKRPPSELIKLLKKPLREMEIYFDTDTIEHGMRLSYKFGFDEDTPKSDYLMAAEEELYAKVILHLKPHFDDRRWDMNVLLDIKVHFSIQMHENGRFMIPIVKGKNAKQFLEEFNKVFHFLSMEELEYMMNVLMTQEERPYYHLACKLHPEKNAEKHLKNTRILLRWTNHLGHRNLTFLTDGSGGKIEGECHGRNPLNANLMEVVRHPAVAVGLFEDTYDQLLDIKNMINDVESGQNIIYQGNGQSAITLQLLKHKMEDFEMKLEDVLYQDYLNHDDLIYSLEDVMNTFQNGISNAFSQSIEKLGKGLENLKLYLEEKIRVNTDVVIEEQRDVSEKINSLANEVFVLKTDMNFKLKNVQVLIKDNFSNTRPDVKNALKKVLETIEKKIQNGIDRIDEQEFIIRENMVANFIKDLQETLGKSKSTIYNYLTKLCKKGLLKKMKIRNGIGRPFYFYYLPKNNKKKK